MRRRPPPAARRWGCSGGEDSRIMFKLRVTPSSTARKRSQRWFSIFSPSQAAVASGFQRGPAPQQIGQEKDAVGAYGALCRLRVDEIVGADALHFGHGGLIFGHLALEPVRNCRRPAWCRWASTARDDVGPSEGAHLLVKEGLLAGGGHPGGGADAAKGAARADGAGTHVGAQAVAAAHDHRRARLQAGPPAAPGGAPPAPGGEGTISGSLSPSMPEALTIFSDHWRVFRSMQALEVASEGSV